MSKTLKKNAPKPPPLWLVSQSPRRAWLLQALGLSFEVCAPQVHEQVPNGERPEQTALSNSRAKAEAGHQKIGDNSAVFIGADTIVVVGNEALGKPKDRVEALGFLQRLSGQTHRVITGLALVSTRHGTLCTTVETQVRMHPLTAEQINEYVDTPEPYDKAGGYAIQGLASLFIDKIQGSYSNVIGLPIETLLLNLAELTHTQPADWIR